VFNFDEFLAEGWWITITL